VFSHATRVFAGEFFRLLRGRSDRYHCRC
jgi:hypothetical protein